MDMLTPQSALGQIVTRSYGWHDEMLFRHTYDASDRTTRWDVCVASASLWGAPVDDPEGWHRLPESAWLPSDEPPADEDY
jgi:hypothetical protein